MEFDGSEDFGAFDPFEKREHPQYDIILFHINRSVQDLFLKALRDQPIELNYIFDRESQVDDFCNRMITYWEGFEEYEICAEIQRLGKKFKEKWLKLPRDKESEKILLREIFKTNI